MWMEHPIYKFEENEFDIEAFLFFLVIFIFHFFFTVIPALFSAESYAIGV